MSDVIDDLERRVAAAEAAMCREIERALFPPPTPEDLARMEEFIRNRKPDPFRVRARRWIYGVTYPARKTIAGWLGFYECDHDD